MKTLILSAALMLTTGSAALAERACISAFGGLVICGEVVK